MNKRKTAVLLLFSFLLIVALSVLPRVVAVISDARAKGKVDSAPMQSVELDFASQKAGEIGYMMRKLALEQNMTNIPIDPEQASMTNEDVLVAALVGMEAYVQANLFTWFEYTYCSVEPYLAIDSEQKNSISIIWGVTLSNQNEPYNYLFLHIDDETGKLLYINYETNDKVYYAFSDLEKQGELLEKLADAFFRPLEELTAGNEWEAFAVDRTMADDSISATYTFEDAQYGTICVELHIMPTGFHVSFPWSQGDGKYAKK